MARIRTIKPEFWTDSLMVQLPILARLLYIALWNAADDHGCIKDEPDRIAMELMPREPVGDVDGALQLLVAAGRLDVLVAEDGYTYYQVPKWEDHQKVDHPAKSKISREGSRKLAIPQATRRVVAEKYGCAPGESVCAECFYCGKPGGVHWFKLHDGRPSSWVTFPELELDHVEPENDGGTATPENIVLACRNCNRSKGTSYWFTFISERVGINPREDSRELALEGKGKERKGTGNKEQGVGSDLHSHILEATTLPSPYQPLTDIQVANIIRTFGLAEADRTQLDGELLRFQDFYTRNPSKSKNPNAYAALTKWLEKVTWRKPPKTAPPRQVASPGLINPGWMEDEHGTA